MKSFFLLLFPLAITSFTIKPASITNTAPRRQLSIMKSTITSAIPNWRTLPDGKEDMRSTNYVSHFAHILSSESEESAGPKFLDAPWSASAYTAALEQYDNFVSCTDSYIEPFIQDALHTLDHAYRLYGPESVIGSFNGGKDAVVILELIRAAHANYYRNLAEEAEDGGSVEPTRPRVIYFNNKLEFPQVYDFVQTTVEKYDLDMLAFEEGVGFVGGLKMLVNQNYLHPITTSDEDVPRKSHPMAFALGTRAGDPNAGKQGAFAPSSSYMPPFMRVNPILEWSYGQIWHFLRLYKLPYCSLYDEGYTSLGTVEDTFPCPALKKVHTEDNAPEYWPAYMLKDWEQERAGRAKKDKKKKDDKKKSTKQEKIAQRNDEGISKCSTVISLPKDKCPPLLQDEEPAEAVVASESDISSIGSASISQRTVGIIIIGDEILKGLTPDTNTHAAASALNANNVPLARVVVVSDDQDEIVAEIQSMVEQVDVIITSGGVGPTHDDVTIKSVASALGSEMHFNEEMAELLKSKMNGGDENGNHELTEAQVKMATIPRCSKLKYLSGVEGDWPVLQCQNIFILPGVPQFFEKKVEHVAAHLSTELERKISFKVVLSIDENSIVPILNNVVENHPNVSFGSYPFVNHPEFKTVVTLEENRQIVNSGIHVKVALSDLVNALPDGSVLRVDNNNDLTF